MGNETQFQCSIRHCAYCLNAVNPSKTHTCKGCKRRAYCSEECLNNDYSQGETSTGSQGHRNWCGLNCGEEDLDWEVVDVPGKGIGVRAIHFIPRLFRIMVNGCHFKSQSTWPAFNDLMPAGGFPEDKWAINSLGCNDYAGSVLCLRIARVNHSCASNAAHYYDRQFKVKILIAERDIEAGEEVCISYVNFSDIGKVVGAEELRERLKVEWGITCPAGCSCFDEAKLALQVQSRALDWELWDVFKWWRSCRNEDHAYVIEKIKRLLNNLKVLEGPIVNDIRILYEYGFMIGIRRKQSLEFATSCLQRAYEYTKAILHPNGEELTKFEQYLKEPESHPQYLVDEIGDKLLNIE